MLGFLTALALVYFGVRYMRRNHGTRRWRRRRREWILDRLSSALGTRPSQEGALEDAVDGILNTFAEERDAFRATHRKFADLMGADEVTDADLEAVFAEQREALDRMQKAAAESLRTAHGALDEDQRGRLAGFMTYGGRRCAPRRLARAA